MEIPVWLQNVLMTLLFGGLLAPGMLLLPASLQGRGAVLVVLAISFTLVVALRRWLR
jgi:hypothetical protein